MTVLEQKIKDMEPGGKVPYNNWYDKYDNENPPANINHKMNNPRIHVDLTVIDAPTFKSKDKPQPPTIAGVKLSQIQLGPRIYEQDKHYLKTVPAKASPSELEKYPESLSKAFTYDKDTKFYWRRKGPFDFWSAHMYSSGKNNYGKWTVVAGHGRYYNRKSFNYTMDRLTDVKQYIKMLKLAPLAGIESHTDYNWAVHMMQGLVNLAYWHYLESIMRLLNISKWEDLPSLTAANDVMLNRVLPELHTLIRSPVEYTEIYPDFGTGRADFVSTYKTTGSYQSNLRNSSVKFNDVNPDSLNYSELSGRPYTVQYFLSQIAGFWGYAITKNNFQSHYVKEIYMPKNLQDYCLQALSRIHDLMLANIEKTVGVQVTVEDEITHEKAKEQSDPFENPFLIYSPSESEAGDKPIFRDISIRPGKQNFSYTSRRVPVKAFKKVPKRMFEMYRRPDATGKLVPQGPPRGSSGGNLLPLLALGATGVYVYTQVKG